MGGGQRIQAGLAHARKTVAVTVGPDTIQVAVETLHHRHRGPDH